MDQTDILDKYHTILLCLQTLVNTLNLTQREFRKHGCAPSVHPLTRHLVAVLNANQKFRSCMRHMMSTPYHDRQGAVHNIYRLNLTQSIAQVNVLIRRSAGEAIDSVRNILCYEHIFDRASNAPKEMLCEWKLRMAQLSKIQTWMRTLMVSVSSFQ